MSSRAVRDLLREIRDFTVNNEIVRRIDQNFAKLCRFLVRLQTGMPSSWWEVRENPVSQSQEVLNDSPAVCMFLVEKFGVKLDTE